MALELDATADHDALIDAWEAAWSGRDPGAFAAACTADVHYEDPFTGYPRHGLAELSEHAERLWAAFPDVRLQRTGERLGDGRHVVAPCRLLGTHLGVLEGIPPSRRFVDMHVLFYAQLDQPGGRLWRIRAFLDAYDAAVQVGVLPRRGTLGERAMLLVRGFGLFRR
ncbi:MAG: ester cyclase [Actinobacteria bacterium]|nr:MAG: ester cyclase [Actinomycetota bacterium]